MLSKIEVVGWFVEDEDVGLLQHEHAEHAADFFTTGKDADHLFHVVTTEEHAAEHGAHGVDFLVVGELGDPFDDAVFALEEVFIVLGEIALGNGATPFDRRRFVG